MKALCKFCQKKCLNDNSLRNHERLCPKNQNRVYKNGMTGKRGSNQFLKAKGLGLPTPVVTNETRQRISQQRKGKGHPHSDETKQKLSVIACNRLEKHSKYSKNVEYCPGVILESSYEVLVAQILDDLGIRWEKVRKGFIWDDNGKTRRYVPDFYLPDSDIYLDPKNNFLVRKDTKKIDSAIQLNGIIVYVLTKDQIQKEYIASLAQPGRAADLYPVKRQISGRSLVQIQDEAPFLS